ncbi:MAG: ParA family protein [Bacteriovoracaceae bacterium]
MGLFSRKKSKNEDHRERSSGQKQAKVIAFLNQKGGVGKTTMAYNVAHALAKKGKKVLALDLDPQANLSMLFENKEETEDLRYEHHVFHLLLNSIRELKAIHSPVLVSEVINTQNSVDLLPSGQELSGFELTVAGVNCPRQLILKNFLQKSDLAHLYDVIIIDCPPTLGLLVVNALCASHGVMVPFRPDDFSRRGLEHLDEVLEDITDMGIGANPKVVAYIPNLVDSRRKQESEDLESLCQKYNEENLGKDVRPFFNRAQLVKAQSQRKSVFEFKNKEYDELKVQFEKLADLIEEFESVQ